MSWNYRVVKQKIVTGGEETWSWGIREVYYDAQGKPTSCTAREVEPWGESFEELRRDMEMFNRALELPVLDYDEFGAKFNEDLIG